MSDFLETDWLTERLLPVGPLRIRVWPSSDVAKVQAQWAAVDVWLGLKGIFHSVSGSEKQKARYLTSSFRNSLVLVLFHFIPGIELIFATKTQVGQKTVVIRNHDDFKNV